MGNFKSIISQRYPNSKFMGFMYRLLSLDWNINNLDGFLENNNCFKINCFDQNDDIVDVFSSHHHEIARRLSKIDYNTNEWQQFYQSLKFIFEVE